MRLFLVEKTISKTVGQIVVTLVKTSKQLFQLPSILGKIMTDTAYYRLFHRTERFYGGLCAGVDAYVPHTGPGFEIATNFYLLTPHFR